MGRLGGFVNLGGEDEGCYWRELPPETALGAGVVKEILTRFQVMLPVVEFLNEPMAAAQKQRAPLEKGWV